MKETRDLDPIELRVLGCLIEKQLTTPDIYPLTLNSLVAACNQQTNREPVMSLSEGEVSAALDRLQDEMLVWRVLGSRATKFDHNLEKRWQLGPASKALMGVLMLRGEQTAGELRTRTERGFKFETHEDIEVQLRAMAAGGLVQELAKRPGQKETRWTHLAGPVAPSDSYAAPPTTTERGEPLSQRVERLEDEVRSLRGELDRLKESLGVS
jgi:uncharacterized protein